MSRLAARWRWTKSLTDVYKRQIVSYLRMGETPESLVERVLPQLTLAQIYDGLSYYHERRHEIDREITENTEEYGRNYLREHLDTREYARISGQTK